MNKNIVPVFIVILILAFAGCGKKQDAGSRQQPEQNITGENKDHGYISLSTEFEDIYQFNIIDDEGTVEITGYIGRIKEIVIPDTVIYICDGAFSEKGLVSVTLPGSLSEIDDEAFKDNLLTDLIIPDSVTFIGERAFEGNNLANISLPDSLDSLSSYVFFNNNLSSVIIPDSITSIAPFAFASNPLTSITIGEDVDLFSIHLGGYLGKTNVFDNGFDDFYEANGRKAGTYIYSDWQWSLQE
jgi:hypothetical protein